MPRPFTDELIIKLFEAIESSKYKYKHKDIMIFFLCSRLGIRINECLKINLLDIDFEDRIITIQKSNSKNKEKREIYLQDDVYLKIAEYIIKYEPFKKGYLFENNQKSLVLGKERKEYINYRALSIRFRKYMRKAGLLIPEFKDKNGDWRYKYRIHDLRTYFCNKVVEANPNKPLSKIKVVTGHKSTYALEIYLDKGINKIKEQRECLSNTF